MNGLFYVFICGDTDGKLPELHAEEFSGLFASFF